MVSGYESVYNPCSMGVWDDVVNERALPELAAETSMVSSLCKDPPFSDFISHYTSQPFTQRRGKREEGRGKRGNAAA